MAAAVRPMRSTSARSWLPMTSTGVATASDHDGSPRRCSGTSMTTVSPRWGATSAACAGSQRTVAVSPRRIACSSAASGGGGDATARRSSRLVAGSGAPPPSSASTRSSASPGSASKNGWVSTSSASAPRPPAVSNDTVKVRRQPLASEAATIATCPAGRASAALASSASGPAARGSVCWIEHRHQRPPRRVDHHHRLVRVADVEQRT